jgi:DNA-binding IclR family transcriptional regulator
MGLTPRDTQDETSARAPSVVKAARILSELAQNPDPMSAADLARRVDVPKSSVADLCLTLAQEGLLARASDGRYLLGRHLVELARPLVGGTRLLEVFTDACEAVRGADGETVTMCVADGADIVIVSIRRGSVLLPITLKVGLRLPIWTTAAGRALLSTNGIEALRTILATETATAAGVSGSLPPVQELHDELCREARLGVHVDDEQTAVGMTSFGAPLILETNLPPTAAIAISTRTALVTGKRRELIGAVVRELVGECLRRSRAAD